MKTYKDLNGWFNYSDLYDMIFDEFKTQKNVVFVEVGVWQGKSITYMADKIKKNDADIKLYGIDNFTGVVEYSDKPEHPTKTFAKEQGGSYYDIYNQNLIDCGIRDYIIDIGKPSLDAVNEFEDESIDFIFIDADHYYDAISQDLNIWYPKVKCNGVFSGHDRHFPGVSRALNEFCKKNDVKENLISKTSWIIKKS